MAWTIRGLNSGRGIDFFLLRNVQIASWDPPSFLFIGYRDTFLGMKRPYCDVYHSRLSNTEVKNEWSYTSTPSVCLHGVDRGNFTRTSLLLALPLHVQIMTSLICLLYMDDIVPSSWVKFLARTQKGAFRAETWTKDCFKHASGDHRDSHMLHPYRHSVLLKFTALWFASWKSKVHHARIFIEFRFWNCFRLVNISNKSVVSWF